MTIRTPPGAIVRTAIVAWAMLACALAAKAQTATLAVVDAGGALTLLQGAIESYSRVNPGVKFVFRKTTAVELPAALKTAQAAGRADVDLVLGGTDILSEKQ